MAQHGTGGTGVVRAMGLGPRFKYAARLLLLSGVLLMVIGLFAESASATSSAVTRREPTLNAHRATFQIPGKNHPHRVFVLSLWGITGTKQHLLGEDSGSTGELIVHVPAQPGCYFQVDVVVDKKFYSGFKRQLSNCGRTAPPTTTTTKPVTTTTKPVTTTTKPAGSTSTTQPQTKGSTGGSTTGSTGGSSSGNGGGGSGTTQPVSTVPGSQLAFTGAGLGMWLTAALGALLVLAGGLMLLYASRYSRAT